MAEPLAHDLAVILARVMGKPERVAELVRDRAEAVLGRLAAVDAAGRNGHQFPLQT